MKPAPRSYRCVQINVYPRCYDQMMPHFTLEVDTKNSNIRVGPVNSHSKANVYGMVWNNAGKKCRIFIAFESKTMHQKFGKYFRKLLKFFNLYNNCENGKFKNEAIDIAIAIAIAIFIILSPPILHQQSAKFPKTKTLTPCLMKQSK